MNIGFMGMGKLGLPCALAMESLGYKVLGYDPSPNIAYSISNRHLLFDEKGADELLKTTKIELVSVERLVRESDLIFVAVQTPHAPEYEGVDVLPSSRDDFDYSFLMEAVINLNGQAESMERKIEVAVISTVLPGTMRGLILPLCSKFINLSYNPYFIAMGTVIRDFLNPEFSLIGGPDGSRLVEFYESIHKKPKLEVSYEEAELIKMSYNTFIGVKIMLANTLTEMCHKVGGDVDVVTGALTLATDRIISGRYMRGGMGDGGHCHLRDAIAMSFLSQKAELSHDPFSYILSARERYTDFLVGLIELEVNTTGMGLVILGKSFKIDSQIVFGSPAILLQNVVKKRGILPIVYDPITDLVDLKFELPSVFFIATAHSVFAEFEFPAGSVVIDPFGMISDRPNVRVVKVGRSSHILNKTT